MEMNKVEPILLTIRSLAEQLIKLIDVFTDSAKIIKEATDEKKVIETKEEPKKEVTLIEVRTALAKLSKEGYTKIGSVIEVSAVTWPAYESTFINSRSNEVLESAKAALERAKELREASVETEDLMLARAKYKFYSI